MAGKQVAKKSESSLPAVPDFMKKDAGLGVEDIDRSDVEIPRLILLQGLSPAVQEGSAKAGNFMHTLLEEEFEPPLEIVPVYCYISYLLFRPRHDGDGGILARADDGVHWSPSEGSFDIVPYKGAKEKVTWTLAPTVKESGLDQFGSYDPSDSDSQPAANKLYNVVCLLKDRPELGPMVLTMQRSSAKVGRKFFGKLKLAQAPIFGLVFKLDSWNDSSSDGDFKNLKFSGAGFVTDQAMYDDNKQWYELFKAQGVKIRDEESIAEEEAVPAASGDEDF